MIQLTLIFLLLFVGPAFANPIPIKLIDLSTPYSSGPEHWNSADYPFAEQALAGQLVAVGRFYNSKRGFSVVGFESMQNAVRRVFIENQCIFGGTSYAAYHWVDSIGPYACIASVNGGGYWWMTRAIEHETAEMIGDPSAKGREIVDSVSQFFGEICDGTFSLNYSVSPTTFPFVDFLLPANAQKRTGFSDYLGQVPLD
jgi:hypothetical protein